MSMEGQGLTWQALEWADGTRCVQEGGGQWTLLPLPPVPEALKPPLLHQV